MGVLQRDTCNLSCITYQFQVCRPWPEGASAQRSQLPCLLPLSLPLGPSPMDLLRPSMLPNSSGPLPSPSQILPRQNAQPLPSPPPIPSSFPRLHPLPPPIPNKLREHSISDSELTVSIRWIWSLGPSSYKPQRHVEMPNPARKRVGVGSVEGPPPRQQTLRSFFCTDSELVRASKDCFSVHGASVPFFYDSLGHFHAPHFQQAEKKLDSVRGHWVRGKPEIEKRTPMMQMMLAPLRRLS